MMLAWLGLPRQLVPRHAPPESDPKRALLHALRRGRCDAVRHSRAFIRDTPA